MHRKNPVTALGLESVEAILRSREKLARGGSWKLKRTMTCSSFRFSRTVRAPLAHPHGARARIPVRTD